MSEPPISTKHELMLRYAGLFDTSQRDAARVTVNCLRRLGVPMTIGGARRLTEEEAGQLTEDDFA